jgi:hypothetical protein
MLLAMMSAAERDKRQKAVDIVIKLRTEKPAQSLQIRKFKVPPINFSASSWDELIDWESVTVTEPPLTFHLTNEQIRAVVDTPLIVPAYPNNTQGVERCIKVVTDASKAVHGEEARDGFIKARISSRAVMPQFDTKKYFHVSGKE